MKKRILSILMALCLCLTLLPTAALADSGTLQGIGTETDPWQISSADTFTDKTGETTPTGPYKETITDESNTTTTYYLPTGHYRLTDTVTLDNYLKITGAVTLDLNGHDLTVGSESAHKHIQVESDAHLTIQNNNSSQTGTATAEFIDVKGTLTLEGGTLQGNATIDASTISVRAGSTITLKGGAVQAAKMGRAIDVSSTATLYAHGGTVEGTVENCGLITHSEGEADTTTFNEPVENGGTIAGGIFTKKVENAYWNGNSNYPGTISGGTFYGEVNNGAVSDDNGGVDGTIELRYRDHHQHGCWRSCCFLHAFSERCG